MHMLNEVWLTIVQLIVYLFSGPPKMLETAKVAIDYAVEILLNLPGVLHQAEKSQ